MEKVTTKAIILQVIDYSDSQLIVQACTQDFGRMGFIASKNTKTSRNKVLLQPLFMVEATFYNNPRNEVQRISAVQLWKPFTDIPFNHGKTFINLFIAELLAKTLREHVANPPMFDFVAQSIVLFDQTMGDFNCFHLSFMAHLSKYLGIYPTFGFNEIKTKASNDILPLLDTLMKTPLSQFSTLSFTKLQRQSLLETLLAYYQLHLPIGELHSHKVLRQF
jgi:DNA repair protein RecO (recombination protein O)